MSEWGSSSDPYRDERLPRVTVDAWIEDPRGRVLLVRRGRPPFQGSWSLPGGFCEWGETTEESCAREAREETGVKVRIGDVLGVYSDPDRDPRGHTVSVLYEARPVAGAARGGDDAADARWFTPGELARLDLAFDHAKIVREQLARRRRARSAASALRARRPGAHSRRARPGGARG
ncbi:MAG TPA: NUDIX hydrolase [Thermoanaerobaculia bacterium]